MVSAHDKDIEAIRAIKLGMAAAQDIEAFSQCFDDGMILYDMLDDSAFGKAAIMEKIGDQFGKVKNIRTRHLDLQIFVKGDVAYTLSVQNFISDGENGAAAHDFNFRGTDIFMRGNGEWRQVHKHLSVPFDMATGQALLHSTSSIPPDKR